jgi:hypothetical protein
MQPPMVEDESRVRVCGAQSSETRQHLRELLQRQSKKQCELELGLNESPTLKSLPWPRDEWQNNSVPEPGSSESFSPSSSQTGIVTPLIGSSPQSDRQNHFRFLTAQSHGSQSGASQPASLGSISSSGSHGGIQIVDPAGAGLFYPFAQQRGAMPQPQIGTGPAEITISRDGTHSNVPAVLDQFNHIGQTPRSPSAISSHVPMSSPMLTKRLIRPSTLLSNQNSRNNQSTGTVKALRLPHRIVQSQVTTDHQELPESVTAELEKLEQEHNDGCVESDLVDLGVDDDELLGMGADFNILEYADPELDQAVGGEKTNILDNLDLEEEKEDDKEESKHVKGKVEKESNLSDATSPAGCTTPTISDEKLRVHSANLDGVKSPATNSPRENPDSVPQDSSIALLQNPPPYPGLPPPYPGRPNSSGSRSTSAKVKPASRAVKLDVIMKGPCLESVDDPCSLKLAPLPQAGSSSLKHPLSLHQRKTLLLQEQPLLLEELLEQEKREQQKQSLPFIGAAGDHNEGTIDKSKAVNQFVTKY